MLVQLHNEYPDKVRLVFRHLPLDFHDKALLSAQAAEAAGKQGKFFEMTNYLFDKQPEWAGLTPEDFAKWLPAAVKALALDEAQFNADYSSEAIVQKVKAAQEKGIADGIPGTPFLLINNRIYQGPRDLNSLKSIVTLIEMEDSQFTECPPMTVDPKKSYTATIKTDKGDIVLKLFPDKAPITVNSFVFLAKQGWFDNVSFHRVLPGFVAQTGDPSGTGGGNPGYFFGNEISDLKFDKPGMVGMANSGPNTNGSQFFITFDAVPNLDGNYTIFAQVIEGMDVAGKLTPRDPQVGGDIPAGDRILSVVIEEK